MDPTDSERAHITYWQLQKAWWFIVNPLMRHSLTVLQVYALMTKMEKNTEKKNQIKSLPTRQKKQKQTNIVFLLLAVLVQHLLTHWGNEGILVARSTSVYCI